MLKAEAQPAVETCRLPGEIQIYLGQGLKQPGQTVETDMRWTPPIPSNFSFSLFFFNLSELIGGN